MATAPKAAPKAGPKAVEVAEAPAQKSNKKLILIAVIGVLVLLIAGGGAAFFMLRGGGAASPAKAEAEKSEPSKLPVFVVMEPFTVNLQSENGDQFLQVTFTLQVPDPADEEVLKTYMPQIRSRLLLLLSSKKAADISTVDGKKKLTDDIIETVNQPFAPNGKPQRVSNVFFTSFVIQ